MSFQTMYKKYPRPTSAVLLVIFPFLFLKVMIEDAPWDELVEGYGYLWNTLKTGKVHL